MNSSLEIGQTKFSRIRLVWKLIISYLVVIVVGLTTMALAAESVAPTSFNRHMVGMQTMICEMKPGIGIERLEADLFDNFRAAVTEALFIAGFAAVVSAVLISLFVTWRVVTPIQQMMQASRRIADGHYQERVSVASEDELGQLGHSFNQMASTLEQTEAMRRNLIANVAHELRTPLASIKGYMEGLIDGVLPDQPDTYQQVYREADRLQRLVSDLQELSQVEAGAFVLDRQSVAMTDLIQQTVTRLRPQFEEKGVTLELDLPSSLPPVWVDEDRVNQVLLNLIGNALQYTLAGGTVTITARVEASELVTIIKDTGLGIMPEHLPHLFTRFYRVDKSRSRAGGGSGIGLTITKHLVEAHSGSIWAESEGERKGSVFGFSLPLA